MHVEFWLKFDFLNYIKIFLNIKIRFLYFSEECCNYCVWKVQFLMPRISVSGAVDLPCVNLHFCVTIEQCALFLLTVLSWRNIFYRKRFNVIKNYVASVLILFSSINTKVWFILLNSSFIVSYYIVDTLLSGS